MARASVEFIIAAWARPYLALMARMGMGTLATGKVVTFVAERGLERRR